METSITKKQSGREKLTDYGWYLVGINLNGLDSLVTFASLLETPRPGEYPDRRLRDDTGVVVQTTQSINAPVLCWERPRENCFYFHTRTMKKKEAESILARLNTALQGAGLSERREYLISILVQLPSCAGGS